MKPLPPTGQAVKGEHIVQVFISEQGPSLLADKQ